MSQQVDADCWMCCGGTAGQDNVTSRLPGLKGGGMGWMDGWMERGREGHRGCFSLGQRSSDGPIMSDCPAENDKLQV